MHSVQEPAPKASSFRKLLRIITGTLLLCFVLMMIFADPRGRIQGLGTYGTLMFGLLFLSLFVKRAI
jgi:hypothetical protein